MRLIAAEKKIRHEIVENRASKRSLKVREVQPRTQTQTTGVNEDRSPAGVQVVGLLGLCPQFVPEDLKPFMLSSYCHEKQSIDGALTYVTTIGKVWNSPVRDHSQGCS